jgi:hypothetical protein
MNKKLFSILLLVLFLFSSSCQKKQVIKTPLQVTPPKQVALNSDWVDEESISVPVDFPTNQSNYIKDPYQELWDVEMYRNASSHFYRDFNNDGVLELCLRYENGSDGGTFALYQIHETTFSPDGNYSYICNLRFYSLEMLPTKHNGYFDLLLFTKTGTLRGGDSEGRLGLFVFNGEQYLQQKVRKYIIQEEAISQKLFNPDLKINQDLIVNSGKGSTKDDEKMLNEKSKIKPEDRNVINPYQTIWGEGKGPAVFQMSRFYLDITNDNIPELFLCDSRGTGGGSYSVYQVTKPGYKFLVHLGTGSVHVQPDIHNGFNDIICIWREGDNEYSFVLMENNGEEYVVKKSFLYKSYQQANDEGLFLKSIHSTEKETYHYLENENDLYVLHWSPQDDDKYRKLIK